MMNPKIVVWKSVQYAGLEYLSLRADETGIHAVSVVIAIQDGQAFRLDYAVDLDVSYQVRMVYLTLNNEAVLTLECDEQRNWFDAHHQPLPHLTGCTDIDISATPFTNTLPIRRLNWQPGQMKTIRLVYCEIPQMILRPDEQIYTCVEKQSDNARFHFEQVATGFKSTIQVDGDGLVIDYPGLYSRQIG